jgi:hypothetical protein
VWTISRATPTAITGTHRVYINGVFKASRDNFNYPPRATATNTIGKLHFSTNWWIGNIDSIAFHPWVLGPAEVQTLISSTSASVCCICMHVYMYVCRYVCVGACRSADSGFFDERIGVVYMHVCMYMRMYVVQRPAEVQTLISSTSASVCCVCMYACMCVCM